MFKKFKKKIKKKFSNSGGQLKPDPDNVITQLPTHEPEDTGNREYTIEYDNSQPSEEDEPEPETNKINEVPPSPPEMPTSGGLIGDRIKLPVRRATSSRYFSRVKIRELIITDIFKFEFV
jgi:hypothetical protein